MKLAIILIGSLLALLLPPGVPAESSSDTLRLAYNPTYDIWFFLPQGRPSDVSQTIQDAYWASRNSGGVCYANGTWFYCKTGDIIESDK